MEDIVFILGDVSVACIVVKYISGAKISSYFIFFVLQC